jgi:hypothetical protein
MEMLVIANDRARSLSSETMSILYHRFSVAHQPHIRAPTRGALARARAGVVSNV